MHRIQILTCLLLGTVAVPHALASDSHLLIEPGTPDDTNAWPMPRNAVQWQHGYDSSLFDAPTSLYSIGFRVLEDEVIQYSSFTIKMSVMATQVGSMSATFADNIGADHTTVFEGPLGFNTVDGQFIDIEFDSAYLYDPSQGDLLVEITHAGSDFGDLTFASYNTRPEVLQRVAIGNLDSETGDTREFGTLVTRFGLVPAPGAMSVLGIGVLVAARRRR